MNKLRKWMVKNYGKKVWEAYKRNCTVPLKDIEANCRASSFISTTFVWDSTSEGGQFWMEIDNAWVNYG